jgi:hypothetical protein
VILNATVASGVALDPRIIPWEAAAAGVNGGRSRGVITVAFVSQLEELSYRDGNHQICFLKQYPVFICRANFHLW